MTNLSPPKGLIATFGVTELITIGTFIGSFIVEGRKPLAVKITTVQLPDTAVSLSWQTIKESLFSEDTAPFRQATGPKLTCTSDKDGRAVPVMVRTPF